MDIFHWSIYSDHKWATAEVLLTVVYVFTGTMMGSCFQIRHLHLQTLADMICLVLVYLHVHVQWEVSEHINSALLVRLQFYTFTTSIQPEFEASGIQPVGVIYHVPSGVIKHGVLEDTLFASICRWFSQPETTISHEDFPAPATFDDTGKST